MNKKHEFLRRLAALCLLLVLAGTPAGAVLNTMTSLPAEAASATKVVVLDPGHGGKERGACYYGMKEKDLNLKIAKYGQAALSQYANVRVVMTRASCRTGIVWAWVNTYSASGAIRWLSSR